MSLVNPESVGGLSLSTNAALGKRPDGSLFAIDRATTGMRGKSVMTNRNNIANGLATSSAVPQSVALSYVFPNGASDLQLVFTNTIVNSAGGEADASAAVTWAASVEYPRGNTPVVFTFAGTSTGTAQLNGVELVTDSLPIDIAVGDSATFVFYASGAALPGNMTTVASGISIVDMLGAKITGATNASPIVIQTQGAHNFTTGMTAKVASVGGNTAANTTTTVTVVDATHFSLDGTVGSGAYTSNGWVIGSDLTATGTSGMLVSGGQVVPAPIAIIGTAANGVRTAYLGILGDSIPAGTGETLANSGYVSRALGGPYGCVVPYIQLARGGTKAVDFADTLNYGSKSIRRRRLVMSAPYVYWTFGVNDFFNAGTLAAVQSAMLSVATQVKNRGNRFLVATITPRSTSSDNFATVSGQTNLTGELPRKAYNTWLRDGAPIDPTTLVAVASYTSHAIRIGHVAHPLWKVVDVAAVCEVDANNIRTLNGGFWEANGVANSSTTDGTHPSAARHLLMAAVIDPTWFVAYA